MSAPQQGSGAVAAAAPDAGFGQGHEELVLNETWWWAVHLCLCSVAIVANLLFLVTIIYNR